MKTLLTVCLVVSILQMYTKTTTLKAMEREKMPIPLHFYKERHASSACQSPARGLSFPACVHIYLGSWPFQSPLMVLPIPCLWPYVIPSHCLSNSRLWPQSPHSSAFQFLACGRSHPLSFSFQFSLVAARTTGAGLVFLISQDVEVRLKYSPTRALRFVSKGTSPCTLHGCSTVGRLFFRLRHAIGWCHCRVSLLVVVRNLCLLCVNSN